MHQYLPFLSFFQQQEDLVGMFFGLAGGIIGFMFGVVGLIAMWKIFIKAGKPGWAVLIPIYNLIVLLEIVGRPVWWLILVLIPLANVVIMFIIAFDLAKSFGKGSGFALGLVFFNLIFSLILGFGSAQYVGPAATS